MKHIGNLTYAEGARHKKKRIGRGPGSGHGGTSTRGHKGGQSRRGHSRNFSFEGGQMPLNRRLPKFGFNNRFRVEYQVVNVSALQKLAEDNKVEDKKVSFDLLYSLGLISKKDLPVKILGNGEISASLNVEAHKFSESAKQKIESAGGTIKLIESAKGANVNE
ncbi:50S ribosomal protein L15 [Bacteroidetes/Chlorobi group bacterium ChocPot_Mid]|jgi:large subunit ribosomal protein L15|nr:MAG: 50S ribosomal protein L15 [Bacteroidetes/Chlorobi group bacterium ChocPot_Mid]